MHNLEAQTAQTAQTVGRPKLDYEDMHVPPPQHHGGVEGLQDTGDSTLEPTVLERGGGGHAGARTCKATNTTAQQAAGKSELRSNNEAVARDPSTAPGQGQCPQARHVQSVRDFLISMVCSERKRGAQECLKPAGCEHCSGNRWQITPWRHLLAAGKEHGPGSALVSPHRKTLGAHMHTT